MSSFHIVENWFILIYQKVLFSNENNSSGLSDVPLCVKQWIDAENFYKNDFVMLCYVKNNGVMDGVMYCYFTEYYIHTLVDAVSKENSNDCILVTRSRNDK